MVYYRNRKNYRVNYRRRYRRKKMPNVKQTSYFTPSNIATGVKYAVQGVNLLKGIINSEKKRRDQQGSGNVSVTPSIDLLTPIDQGDEVNERNGNSVLAKYFTFGCTGVINPSAFATIMRYIIFVDNDNDGQTPTATELLTNVTNMHSALNPDYTSRFTILADRFITLSQNGKAIEQHDIFKRLDFHIKYITGTGSTGFGKSNIWLLLYSNEDTNVPTFDYNFRLVYYDN